MGTVMSCSTSSAESPRASVWISTYGGVNSGRRSTGVSRSCVIPAYTRAAASGRTRIPKRRLDRTIHWITAAHLRAAERHAERSLHRPPRSAAPGR
jgi:hypothetical protein